MKIVIETDVAQVAQFMMDNVKPQHYRRVAHALVMLAEMFWTEEHFNKPVNEVLSFHLDSERSMAIYLDHPEPSHEAANGP